MDTTTNPRAAPNAAGSTKLKVLALHSFRTSAAIFRQQFEKARMVDRLNDLVDVVYLDAPNPASGPIPRDVAPFFKGPYYEWFKVETHGDKLEFDVGELERSLTLVADTLRTKGPFDGLVGFSQGTVMASSIIALQQAGLLLHDIPKLKFCVLFAGFKSRYPPHAPAWQSKISVPSMHIFGDRDDLRVQCKELADAFENPVIMQHTRGHSIPFLDPVQLSVMRAFLTSIPDHHHQKMMQPPAIMRQPTYGTAPPIMSMSSADEDGGQPPVQRASSTSTTISSRL